MKDFWEFDDNPPTIQEFLKKIQYYSKDIGEGSHGIKPEVNVALEDGDEEFKLIGIQLDMTGCGCATGITLMIEKVR